MQQTKDQKVFITPAGALVALICFFLPWVKVSCMGVKTMTGADIASQNGLFYLIPLAAVAILVAYFFFKKVNDLKKIRLVTWISAGIALAIMIVEYLRLSGGTKTEFGTISAKELGLSIEFGAIGSLLGFVAALVGLRFLKTGAAPVVTPEVATVPKPETDTTAPPPSV